MNPLKKPPSHPSASLRERAEKIALMSYRDILKMPSETVQRLVDELQIHQIELEFQNQELRDAHAALAESRDRYADLYRTALIDITERKRLDEQLRLAEARSSVILCISADAIVSIDETQRITSFNEGAERIFGYSKEEVVGNSLDVLIPEGFRPIHGKHIKEFMTGQEVSRRMGERGTAIFGRRKNGQEFPADAAISKIEIAGKRIITVALRDITEEKRIEREQTFLAEVGAVLASTLDYEETLRNIAGLAVRDLADFCIVDVVEEDGSLRRLKVLSREPSHEWICDLFMGVSFDRRCPNWSESVIQHKLPVLVARPSPETISSFFKNEQDRRALRAADFKSLIVVPLPAHGKLVGVIALVSTSSTRLYGPADVRLAEELAQRAALSIANARLFKEARRAVKIREDVLAIVSHELKNPVGTIGLAAHLLRQFDPPDAVRLGRLADTIEHSVGKMKLLIDGLLDLDKIHNGTFSLERSPASMARLMPPVIDGFRLLAENRQQTLEMDLPADLPDVVVDGQRIGQVMSNLVGNAIKFTPEGGRIRVSARLQGNEVVVSVTDTGPGIPYAELPKVFDWFWQAKDSRHLGSGLGLSIAKGIVEAHEGRIWAESQIGQGSSFLFSLPVAPETKCTDKAA
jgi:PAS domain S-box-containing protein